MVRGTTPYILLQDDLALKNTSNVQWAMHTRAEVSASGNKATLTQNKQTLTATILSPAGATFTAEDAPEPAVETMKKLTGIRVLKINLADVKGTQTVAVSFALGDQAATAPVKPIAEWIPKK